MKLITIEATDIPDAWFQCLYSILDNGHSYTIEQGSFVGEKRLEFDWVAINIKFPYRSNYDLMLPDIPEYYGIPNPVEKGYIEQYLPYLMTGHFKPGEQYTYGSRITSQIEKVTNLLRKTPFTNQAILQVASPMDVNLPDPPCLRHIDIRLKNKELIFYPYFRSWDLWGGFPVNLAAIAVLQKSMADDIEAGVGPIVASSKGLHIYKYVEKLARLRTGKRNATY